MTEVERFEMNFLKYLGETKTWDVFKNWYERSISLEAITPWPIVLNSGINWHSFIQFPFEFQKGIFEKFLVHNGCEVTQNINHEQDRQYPSWSIWNKEDGFLAYNEEIRTSILTWFKFYERKNNLADSSVHHHIGI